MPEFNYLIVGGVLFGFLLIGDLVWIYAIKKIKPQGSLKNFLKLTLVSLVGFFVSVLLHNLASALLSTLLNKDIDEPVFFLLAGIVFPLGFVVGVIGSIFQTFKVGNRS